MNQMKFFLFSLLLISFSFWGCQKDTVCTETIDSNCICIEEYQPVCGCNNKTYGNACKANCANVTIARDGTCL